MAHWGRSIVGLLAIVGALAGCAHRTRIESNPAGRVFVRGAYVCTTPCVYSTPATQLDEHTPFRIERDGYKSVEGELETAILPSRIVAGLFTLGLVPLFKWPHTYRSVHSFELQPLTREERLADLEDRLHRGQISEDEYRYLRLRVLEPH